MKIFAPKNSPTVKTIWENQGGLMPLCEKTFATFGNANVTRNVRIPVAIHNNMIG